MNNSWRHQWDLEDMENKEQKDYNDFKNHFNKHYPKLLIAIAYFVFRRCDNLGQLDE